MKKFEIILALEQVAAARKKWNQAERKFRSDLGSVMRRLILEAAHNRMSAEDVGRNSGYSAREIRRMMRDSGLDPKKGKTLLAKQSADALAENAALLGVDPREMDLTSPLAYLPMGSVLREFLETSRVTGEEIDAEISEADPLVVEILHRELGDVVDRDVCESVALALAAPRCWCTEEVGPRVPGDADGLGCLADINHDWRNLSVDRDLPLHRTEVSIDRSCSTCDGGGCPDCTDPA